MKIKLYLILIITFCSFQFSIAQVGVGTTSPNSYLDVKGDLALREGTAITVAAGANNITLTGEYSHYRLTGASGAFNINTIIGGNDGQVLTLINVTGQIMTVNNNNAANGILTGDGANLVAGSNSNTSVTMIYNATLARWTVTGSTGTIDSKSWNLTGNTATATDFIGTTSASTQPFRIATLGTERMRILSDGNVAINNTAPAAGDLFTVTTSGTNNYGINAYNSLSTGSAIYAINSSTSVSTSAIEGNTSSGEGAGVLGISNGTTTGGLTPSGVVGQYSGASTSGTRIGVKGYSANGNGNRQIGVQGSYNTGGWGIGVVGLSMGGSIPTGNNDIAVVGWRTNNANYSGYFNGNHVIANGTKSASVGTSKGNQLLYVTEAPEVWFEDLGGGQLVNGTTHISLDDMYLETIFVDNTHPMRIFLQEEGESNGLIVIKDADNKGFTVKEKNNGTSNISFSYRIMAKRLHFQDHRFGNDPVWGGGDTRKYNQYAPAPPVDYNENVRFQEEQKKNYKPTPMPEGFIDYMTLQKQAQQLETKKTEKKQ